MRMHGILSFDYSISPIQSTHTPTLSPVKHPFENKYVISHMNDLSPTNDSDALILPKSRSRKVHAATTTYTSHSSYKTITSMDASHNDACRIYPNSKIWSSVDDITVTCMSDTAANLDAPSPTNAHNSYYETPTTTKIDTKMDVNDDFNSSNVFNDINNKTTAVNDSDNNDNSTGTHISNNTDVIADTCLNCQSDSYIAAEDDLKDFFNS
mmetsp:Transcript_30735/g.37525  ORF Transcript_30735/g.37525 Transcript_30735/m.37525 type:complete len:210 (+) Transcript_30735:121-750(+)